MAQTPWGEMPVQDSHVHFFSHEFYAALARQKKLTSAEELQPLLGWDIPPANPAALAETWIEEMNKHGIERLSLMSSLHGDESSAAAACAFAPHRFYGYFMLDPTNPDAFDRLSAAATNPGLHTMCLFPAMHTYSIADGRIVPLLELASDSQLSVLVHCGALSMGVRKRLGLTDQFNLSYSNPLHLHPVALHFPKVRFIVPHFGAGLLRETLMLADLCPNVYLDTSSSNRWMRYEGLDLRTVWQRALSVVGVDRLLFGTDSSYFPRGWNAPLFDEQVKTMYELGLNANEAGRILRFNLENLHAGRNSVGLS